MSLRARTTNSYAHNNHFLRRIFLVISFAFFVVNLSSVANASPPPALAFVPVTPCRIVDTRTATGPVLAAGSTRDFPIPNQHGCNIPATAAAYALNFTVVPRGPLGYLSVWPTGASQPLVSTLNSYDGRVKANAAIIPAGTGGAITVYVTDETDLVVDISGYFEPVASNSSLAFFTLPPCRVADTRNPDGSLGGPFLAGGQQRPFPILASSCGVPAAAAAYSLNFTVVPHGPLGYLTVWPTGETQPVVSTLNSYNGQVIANAAIVPAGISGQGSAYVSNDTDLVIDVNGYFAPVSSGSSPLLLYNATPCRVLDTRTTGQSLPLTAAVAGHCMVPSLAEAIFLNATVIPADPLGFLTLWPDGITRPLVSTLNAYDGSVSSNMAIVPTSNGSIDAYSSDKTDLVLDVNGYFAPAPPAGSLFVVIPGNSQSNPSGVVAGDPGNISCGWAIFGGSGTDGISCLAIYETPTVVTLTAGPGDGYVFEGWSGGCSGTAKTCTLTVNGAVSVTANFAHPTITLKPTDINWLEISNVNNIAANAYPGESSVALGQYFGAVGLNGCPSFISYSSLVSFNPLHISG